MPHGREVLTKKRAHGAEAGGSWLLMYWEGGSQAHPLGPDARLVLGRGEDADLYVPHESVSRRHAVLTGSAGTWTLEDLGSSNGTFAGGTRLKSGAPRTVKPGTVMMLGDARLVLDDRDSAKAVVPQSVATEGLEEPMGRVMRLVELVADSILPVLLLGDTGVGKGRLAEQIHLRSSRASAPFVRLNCAAVPESLLESELFGHERGAFTGAVAAKPGIIETADRGTVFLDEIGEVPRSTQAKLLHVLEHNEVMRVGAVKPRRIDVRFLAATNRELESLVEGGHFRRDLYFRLAGVPLRIPTLRERTDEIPEMARAFMQEACARPSRPVPAISDEAMESLLGYAWPGNIRELRNVVMRAALLCKGASVLPEHLMLDLGQTRANEPRAEVTPHRMTVQPPALERDPSKRLETDLRDFERNRVVEALAKFGGHQGKTAEYLGVSRRTLTNKLNELALPRPRKGKS